MTEELEHLRRENELVRRNYSGLLAFVKDVARDPLNAKHALAQELLATGVFNEPHSAPPKEPSPPPLVGR